MYVEFVVEIQSIPDGIPVRIILKVTQDYIIISNDKIFPENSKLTCIVEK